MSVLVNRLKNLTLQIQTPLIVRIQTAKLFEGNKVEGSRNCMTFSYVILCDTSFLWFLKFLLICTDGQRIAHFELMGHILSNLY